MGLYGGHGHSSDRVTKRRGITREFLVNDRKLSTELLDEWQIKNVVTNGVTHIEIPYLGIDGKPTGSIRRRHAKTDAEGQRFSWKKGSAVYLYGMQKLEEIRRKGWVLLVEGETDTLTAWQVGIPALGIAGKSMWKPEYAELLKGLEVVLWVEPDAESLAVSVAKDLQDLKVIQAVPPIKDISQALTLGVDVAPMVQEARKHSVPATGFIKAIEDNLREKVAPVLESDDPLELVEGAMKAGGFGGDLTNPIIVYLAMTSRLIKMHRGSLPVHTVLVGESSAGKSFIVQTASALFPSESVNEIQAGSPTAFIYGDYPTKHAVLIFGEADSLPAGEDSPAASAIRSLLTDHFLRYAVTIPQKSGEPPKVFVIEKEGPTVLITTTVKPLGDQMMTRMFTLEVVAGDDHINRVLDKMVLNHLDSPQAPPQSLIDFQKYLQNYAPWDVVIPYVGRIRNGLPVKQVPARLMRDWSRIISLIQAVTIIRHHKRRSDETGRLVSDVADYETVYDLVNDMYIDTVSGVTPSVTAVVDAVAKIKSELPAHKTGYSHIERELGIHREQIRRDVKKAVARGWLIDLETKPRSPRDLIVGDPIPTGQGLPTPESIRHAVTGVTKTDLGDI
jgi:hypothetical protein